MDEQLQSENEKFREALTLITIGGGTPEERRAFVKKCGGRFADADGIARAALGLRRGWENKDGN